MTNEEAARILQYPVLKWSMDWDDRDDGLSYCEAIEKAIESLRDNHFPDTTKMVPLTPEQLREMDGKPVWVKVLGWTDIRCDGWCEVDVRHQNTTDEYASVAWPGSEVEDIGRIEDYGKTWIAYAYQPAHIDREAWKPCECCKDAQQIHGWAMSVQKSKEGTRCMTNFEGTFNHCPECGRPLTEEAWAKLEKRLRGLQNG